MKRTMLRLLIATLLLVGVGSAPVFMGGGTGVPMCWPRPCPPNQ